MKQYTWYEVFDLNDDRVFFAYKQDAKKYAADKGQIGCDAQIKEHTYLVLNHIDEVPAFEKEKKRRAALAKLTGEERSLLNVY